MNPEAEIVHVSSSQIRVNKRILRDIEEIQEHVFSDSKAKVHVYHYEAYKIELTVVPLVGLFAYQNYEISLLLFPDYPFSHPKLYSNTNATHPNIHFDTGQIIFKGVDDDSWVPTTSLLMVIERLIIVLINTDQTCVPSHPLNIKKMLKIQGDPNGDVDDNLSVYTDDGHRDQELGKCKNFFQNFEIDEDFNDKEIQEEILSNETDKEEESVPMSVDLSKSNQKRKLCETDLGLFKQGAFF